MSEENVGSTAMFKARLLSIVSISTKDFLSSTRSQEYRIRVGIVVAWLVARMSFKTGKTPH